MIAGAAARRAATLGLALTLGSGCTLLLDPERIDDIPRCDFDDDCPAAEDPRYELVCTVDAQYEDQDIDFPKICSPRPSVSCNPHEYPFDSVIASRYREATAQLGRYEEHCTDQPGVQGCLPGEGSCLSGLSPHAQSHRCDDGDEDTPPAIGAEPTVSGQDVLDQFCRAVYCNISFACRARDFRCVPCTLGDSIGQGGCGDLYIGGQRSSVYQSPDELEAGCGGAELDPADAFVGPVGEGDIEKKD